MQTGTLSVGSRKPEPSTAEVGLPPAPLSHSQQLWLEGGLEGWAWPEGVLKGTWDGRVLLFYPRCLLNFGSFLFDLIVSPIELGSHINQIRWWDLKKEQDQTGRVDVQEAPQQPAVFV